MTSVFILIYSILIILLLFSLSKRNIKLFLVLFGITFSFSPLMQYVIFPEYKTFTGYRAVSIERIFFEYVNTFLLLIAFTRFKTIRVKTKIYKTFKIIIFLWVIFNLFSVFFSINFARSLNAFFISVLNPVLFAGLFNNKKIIHDSSNFIVLFFCILICFNLGIKYLSIFYNYARGAIESAILLGHGSVEFGNLRGNSATNFLSFFLPMLLVNQNWIKNDKLRNLLKVTKILLIFVFSTSGSRTGYFLISIFLLFSFFSRRIKIKQFLQISIILTLSFTIFSYLNQHDFSNFLFDRFTAKGETILESASNDERLILWSNSIEKLRNNNFKGLGISNYFLVFKKYSNAHNLYINIIFERGILVLLLFLLMTIFSIKIQIKNINSLRYSHNKVIFMSLLIGLNLFLIASTTGEDFLSISQTVHAFSSYIFSIIIFYPIYFYNEFSLKN